MFADVSELGGRSREGAWIEITDLVTYCAPAACRSREGAWIEIDGVEPMFADVSGRSREGAWIEIWFLR